MYLYAGGNVTGRLQKENNSETINAVQRLYARNELVIKAGGMVARLYKDSILTTSDDKPRGVMFIDNN